MIRKLCDKTVNALVNMSQMIVSQMSSQNTTPSPQQRQHWLRPVFVLFINSSILQPEVHR
jgi:hypothetical protein